jgi:hypothetical protein
VGGRSFSGPEKRVRIAANPRAFFYKRETGESGFADDGMYVALLCDSEETDGVERPRLPNVLKRSENGHGAFRVVPGCPAANEASHRVLPLRAEAVGVFRPNGREYANQRDSAAEIVRLVSIEESRDSEAVTLERAGDQILAGQHGARRRAPPPGRHDKHEHDIDANC